MWFSFSFCFGFSFCFHFICQKIMQIIKVMCANANCWLICWIALVHLHIYMHNRIYIYNSISKIMFGYWFSIFFLLLWLYTCKKETILFFCLYAPSHSKNCISWESSVIEHSACSWCRCIPFSCRQWVKKWR